MQEKLLITSQGYILKKEKLASLASQRKISELILEDLDPFPGFYDHYFVPANKSENMLRSLFILVKELDISIEDNFIRTTMQIKQEHAIKYDAAMAILHLYHKPVPCIRLFMEEYDQLPELISHYKQAGIKFKARKEIKPFQSLIEVRKFFEMKSIGEGIYIDLDQAETYYLMMPLYLSWDYFERITIIIRNIMSQKLYDAAQAAIYEKSGLVDFIRIYSKNIDLETLIQLRQKYLNEIERM